MQEVDRKVNLPLWSLCEQVYVRLVNAMNVCAPVCWKYVVVMVCLFPRIARSLSCMSVNVDRPRRGQADGRCSLHQPAEAAS